MIEVKGDQIKLIGSPSDLLTETTIILKNVRKALICSDMPEKITDGMIDKAVSLSRIPESNFKEHLEKEILELASKIFGGGAADDGSLEEE